MDVTFSMWDLAGQEVYYATHQCFLSRNTLYLVVWNMTEGEQGIDYLRPWLLNVQVMIGILAMGLLCFSLFCVYTFLFSLWSPTLCMYDRN